MWTVLLLAVVALGLWKLSRLNELFRLSVRDGRVLVVTGQLPGSLLADFREALKRVPAGSVTAARDEDGARLFTTGVPEGIEQRLRNIFALYPMSRLRAQGPAPAGRSLGQRLGIAWLAWLLHRDR